ncbi:MAG TPA: Tol-Pal system protein TolB [Candidatus Aquabacterium excrementipullorum]|nr:Tol-Pal system protein TolB [Candidatus Aquabacterium excrementipullorum]
MQEPTFSYFTPAGCTRRRIVAALGLAGALGLTAPAWAQFRVQISGVGATQIPIAIGTFRDEQRSPQPISAIVRADLERSGLFKSLDASADRLDEASNPSLNDWKTKGADALLAGSVSPLADGRFDVRYKLWDVLKARDLTGRQGFVVPTGDLRLTAHRIADDIYEKLTGDKGVFSTRIAYVSKAGRRYTLLVADADGENAQSALTSQQPIISPAWAPDGKRLAYVSFQNGKAEVISQEIATGKRRMLASFKGSNSAPAWSPDGRQLVVTLSRDGVSQLYLISADGEGAPRKLTSSSSIDTEAAFSPDGSLVYFVSDRGGGPQVYKVPVAGGTVQRVTFNGAYNISPNVSPDGKWLTYIGQVGGGAFRVHLMDLSSGDTRPLSDTRDDERPSFAPNGKLIIYATRQQGRDVLMTTSLDGRIKATLATSQSDVRQPVWGPFNK